MRQFKNYLLLTLKGMGMGASDVVPGVSGGTIAFITGIYEELIHSIKSINLHALKLLISFRISEFWKAINGWFLVAVFTGVLISVFSLAHILEYLLIHHPSLIWAFFFGLVLSSAIMILTDIKEWSFSTVFAVVLGAVIAFWITTVTPAQGSTAYYAVFLSGALAICAMILPGISGSFILLLLGKYQFILNAVSEFKIPVLLVFLAGAIVGLIAFSNILSFLLKKFRFFTIALLAGFMIGSLNKIWPWKETVETYTDSRGVVHPLIEKNILPEISAHSTFFPALLLAILGFVMIVVIYRLSIRPDEVRN